MKHKFIYLGVGTYIFSLIHLSSCTIFTLTDSSQTLFCNNEDWKDPNTQIWFIPGEDESSGDEKSYGCAFVGFSNQWGQGGVNTQGLAYDWVAGFSETWKRDHHKNLKKLKGNPAEKMLKTCANVEDAIQFYETYWEPGFSYAKILIADRSGTSVIIGAKDDKLIYQVSNKTRGFGYGQKRIKDSLSDSPEVSLQKASMLLEKAVQLGTYATRYSTVFDLNTGDIFIYRPSDFSTPVQLDLEDELD